MAIKRPYTTTEFGTFPTDWMMAAIGTIATVEGGYAFSSKKFLRSGKFQVIKMSNLYGGTLDLGRSTSFLEELTEQESHFLLCRDQIIITLTGTTGKRDYGYFYKIEDERNLLLNQRVARIVVQNPHIAGYLAYQLGMRCFQDQFFGVSKGGTGNQTNVGTQDVAGMKVPLPQPAEQKAITAALADVDALLRSLERLIAKKRDLKQATMQQLLTGQTRLPGFQDEWSERRLGDLGSTYGGLTGKTKADFGEGAGRYVTFMNVMSNVLIDCDSFEQVRIVPNEVQNRVMMGDLLFNGSSETPEEVAMCAMIAADIPNLFLNSFCFGFRLRDAEIIDGLFLAYYLRSKVGRELMKSLAQGSTRYNLSKAAFLRSQIRLPSAPEQTAISTVLRDIDTELSMLEQRLAKTRDLKLGMMQELLTGRTRLI